MDKIKVRVCCGTDIMEKIFNDLHDADIVITEHLTLSVNEESIERWSNLFVTSPEIIQTLSEHLRDIRIERGNEKLANNIICFHTWWADSNDVLKSLKKAFGDLEIFIPR